MFYDEPRPPVMVEAQPGHMAISIRDKAAHLNAVVAWEISPSDKLTSAYPITLLSSSLNEETPRYEAVRFPDGHVEDICGERRWSSLADFCRAHKVKVPAPA